MEGVEERALSISLTRLSISGSGTWRNWNREVIRGRNLPRRCCPISMFRNFRPRFPVSRALQLPELAFQRPTVKNSSRMTGTSHRFSGSSLQQVVIIPHTTSRSHRFAFRFLGRRGRSPDLMREIRALRPRIPSYGNTPVRT